MSLLTCIAALVTLSPAGNVEVYLNLMDRLHTAVEFFTQSNPGSVELGSVVSSAIVCVPWQVVVARLLCLRMAWNS